MGDPIVGREAGRRPGTGLHASAEADSHSALVARLHGVGDIRLGREPRPAPAAGEVLVQVTSVGLCGSDRHWFADAAIGDTRLAGPMVLGHEIAGVIASGPRSGERVAIDPSQPCERCATCRRGRPDLCPDTRFAGHGGTDGGLRTWMTWPDRLCVLIPDHLSDDDGALMEPLGVALHAVALAEVDPRDAVAVIGSGPIGQLVVKALLSAGISDVVVSDRLPHRVASARAAGATDAWLADVPPTDPPIEDIPVVIECAGDDAAVDAALRVARPGGRVVLVGIPSNDRTAFRASLARRKGLTLVLSRRMTAADLPAAIAAASAGRIEVGSMISDRFALAEVGAAFARLASRAGNKVVVRPGE
jgi:L-iditol 2-dehydrogenase